VTNLHDGSAGDPRPIPDTVTVSSILDRFARKLTELNDRNMRLAGQELAQEDPRDIAAQIFALAHNMEVFASWGEGGGGPFAEAIGAQAIAFLLARARVDDSRVDLGGEAA
jgi:hypothetical protein